MVDTRFALPAVDDPASTEVGVILMGLDAPRLLAGLGIATLADDPTLVTLMVDRVRHDVPGDLDIDGLIATGARRWHTARRALASVDRSRAAPSAALRQAWAQASRAVDAADLGRPGPAGRAYLTACWLRRTEVDSWVAEHQNIPDIAS